MQNGYFSPFIRNLRQAGTSLFEYRLHEGKLAYVSRIVFFRSKRITHVNRLMYALEIEGFCEKSVVSRS